MEFTTTNLITIILVIFNLVITIMVKLNDLKHVQKTVDILVNKVDELRERVSRMEGIISVKKLKPKR